MKRQLRLALLLTGATCSDRSADAPVATAATAALDQPALIDIGQEQYWRDQLDSAESTFTAALADSRVRDDSTGMALAWHWHGLTNWKLGDLAAAHAYHDSSLALKLRLGLDHEIFASYNAMGLLTLLEGNLRVADSLFTLAQGAAERTGDVSSLGKVFNNRALVQVDAGGYVAARNLLTKAWEITRAAGSTRDEGKALANMAMLDIREGNGPAAIPRLAAARERYRRVEYVSGEVDALGQLATALQLIGDYQAALAAADSALQLARRHGLRYEEAANLDVLSVLYAELGDEIQALRMLELAQRIYAELGTQVELATDLRRSAELRFQLGQAAGAVEAGRAALRVHEQVGAHPERLADLLFLATADSAHSAKWADQARRLADSLGFAAGQRTVALVRADLAIGRRDWGTAAAVLAGPLQVRASLAMVERWQLAVLLSRVERGRGRLDRAEHWAREAVSSVERVRASMNGVRSRSEFAASRSETYTALVEILLDQGRVEDAFEVADAARGRALLEHLASYEGDSSDAELTRVAGEERTLHRIATLTREAEEVSQAEGSSSRVTELRSVINQLGAEYERSIRLPSGPTRVLGREAATALATRAVLRADEAVLEYLIGATGVHAFLVTPERVFYTRLEISPEDLASRVRLTRGLLSRPGDAAVVHGPLAALRRSLLGDLESKPEWPAIRVLYLVPHGVTGLVPFAALRDGTSGRYLVQDKAVATMASAATLIAMRDREGESTWTANPVAAFAPFPGSLPGTKDEIEQIGREKRSRLARGKAATEAAVRDAMRSNLTIHLASHGRLNPENPLFSRMELYPGGAADPRTDGRLEAHEVLGIRLRSPLVYLSGCETGQGPIGNAATGQGEEYESLAQAFLYAGASGVIGTTWRIPDAGSVLLVDAFYRALPGAGPLAALAAAQRSVLEHAPQTHPYYWAGHVYSGARLDPTIRRPVAVKRTAGP